MLHPGSVCVFQVRPPFAVNTTVPAPSAGVAGGLQDAAARPLMKPSASTPADGEELAVMFAPMSPASPRPGTATFA
jgi:hypothetical protein